MDTKKIVSARKEAGKAIAGMPDGDLKVKAFEVILGHLLAAGSDGRKPPVIHKDDELKANPSEKGKVGKSTAARILLLRDEGFFKSQKSMGEIIAELAAHGWHYAKTAMSGRLQTLTQQRKIRRVRSKKGNKTVWLYSEP
jgi:hypothetical protein